MYVRSNLYQYLEGPRTNIVLDLYLTEIFCGKILDETCGATYADKLNLSQVILAIIIPRQHKT